MLLHIYMYIFIDIQMYAVAGKPEELFLRGHKNTFSLFGMTEHWKNLPREIVESPSLLIFESHMDMVQGNTL